MKIGVGEGGGILLEDVFNGIGIKTDQGLFGVAQRDMGIEVMLDGVSVWSSTEMLNPMGLRAYARRVAEAVIEAAARPLEHDRDDEYERAETARGFGDGRFVTEHKKRACAAHVAAQRIRDLDLDLDAIIDNLGGGGGG